MQINYRLNVLNTRAYTLICIELFLLLSTDHALVNQDFITFLQIIYHKKRALLVFRVPCCYRPHEDRDKKCVKFPRLLHHFSWKKNLPTQTTKWQIHIIIAEFIQRWQKKECIFFSSSPYLICNLVDIHNVQLLYLISIKNNLNI